ncbi:putative coatomer subunit zeta [Porphyridium purpureum]|uniref:Coatomer subunit zeta n=1 Tax=Porphyridium purpureum TaxID=35688 RepID=A0A5J4YSU0_PORPP|nr:putative coatomer subunit zeta [Porphyridium purpureum]|eukprot:POR6153..scf236_6
MILTFLVASYTKGGVLFSRFFGPNLATEAQQATWLERIRHATASEWALLASDYPEQVALVDECTIVTKLVGDVVVLVAGNREHDALLILEFLRAFETVFRKVCKVPATKPVSAERRVLESYWNLCLIVDEMIDEGAIDHLDCALIEKQIAMKPNK